MNHATSISSLARKLTAAGAAVALGTLSLAGLGPIGAAGAATVAFDLCATTGTASFPSGTTSTTAVSFWGYAPVNLAGCGAATLAHPGGPTLVVDEGDSVTINLHNNLAEPTSLDIGGQALESDVTGTGQGTTKSYTFTAAEPGTYLYQAGLTANGPQEAALGLYGALVVRPAGAAGQAYGDAASAFDVEGVLVLGELDPALTPANYAGFDMRNYAPKWGLINGLPYPSTTPIAAAAGNKVLLRYLNAGSFAHSMGVLGANQTQLATDGHRLPADRHFVAETFGPGETADVLVPVPAAATAGSRLACLRRRYQPVQQREEDQPGHVPGLRRDDDVHRGGRTGRARGTVHQHHGLHRRRPHRRHRRHRRRGRQRGRRRILRRHRRGQRLRHGARRGRRRLRRGDRARDVDDAADPGPRRPHRCTSTARTAPATGVRWPPWWSR